MHKTSAWPLAWTYIALVIYASLYPFSEWRDQGMAPWAFLTAPLPKYWTGFDVAINVAGYAPLGFLLALSALRSRRVVHGVLIATLAAALLSLLMEGLQGYLPARVPSNVDLVLNVLGAWVGASIAAFLERLGVLDRWNRIRARWFVPEARGALVLLALGRRRCCFRRPCRLVWGRCWKGWKRAWRMRWSIRRSWTGCRSGRWSCSSRCRWPKWPA